MRKHTSYVSNNAILSSEMLLVKKYISKWLIRLMDYNIDYNDSLFDCIGFIFGTINELAKQIIICVKDYNNSKRDLKVAKSTIKELEKNRTKLLSDAMESLIEDNPFILETIKKCIIKKLENNIKGEVALVGKKGILEPLKKLFDLNNAAIELCFLAYACKNYDPISNFFHCELAVFSHENSHVLATILGIDGQECLKIKNTLFSMGILIYSSIGSIGLMHEIDASIKGINTKNLKDILCAPLPKGNLPLEEFNIDEEDKKHILRLLKLNHSEPCQLLIYGKPGLGKTSFVQSLATALNIKVFQVICSSRDTTEDRRTSLTACINLSRRYDRAAVLVDEAERILNTDSDDFRFGTAKAWLNGILEDKNNRIIWICNHISHLDHAVRRRFSYSVKFPELSSEEQIKIWNKTAERLRVSSKLPNDEIKRLVNTFNVPVSCIESSIRQAKAIATKADFIPCIERFLKAYTILENDGYEPDCDKVCSVDDYALDGISTSIPVTDFVDWCGKVYNYYKNNDTCRGGIGNALFHGVSGGGKGELAKYVAKTLEIPCIIKRTSQLIDAYVGSTEKNIAMAFEEAKDKGGLLLLDEADSFIPNRQSAEHSWDITMTNEFLTQLEAYKGICICTTNFRECLDSAVMRRFNMKIEFKYAEPKQLVSLYSHILAPLVNSEPPKDILECLCMQKNLAAGDFNNVRNQYMLEDREKITHQALLQALMREANLKLEAGAKKLGFAS